MRRNVRRLNREIGNHGSSLPVSTQVSLPLTLPTSYQPRSQEKKIINNLKSNVTSDPEPMPAAQAPIVPVVPYNMPMTNPPIVDSAGALSRTMITEQPIPYSSSPQVDVLPPEGTSFILTIKRY